MFLDTYAQIYKKWFKLRIPGIPGRHVRPGIPGILWILLMSFGRICKQSSKNIESFWYSWSCWYSWSGFPAGCLSWLGTCHVAKTRPGIPGIPGNLNVFWTRTQKTNKTHGEFVVFLVFLVAMEEQEYQEFSMFLVIITYSNNSYYLNNYLNHQLTHLCTYLPKPTSTS